MLVQDQESWSQRLSKGWDCHILSMTIGMHHSNSIDSIHLVWADKSSCYFCQRMTKRLASVGSFHSSAGIGGSINEEVHLEADFEANACCFGLQTLARVVAYWTRLQKNLGGAGETIFQHFQYSVTFSSLLLLFCFLMPTYAYTIISFSHGKPYPLLSSRNHRGPSILIHGTPARFGKLKVPRKLLK